MMYNELMDAIEEYQKNGAPDDPAPVKTDGINEEIFCGLVKLSFIQDLEEYGITDEMEESLLHLRDDHPALHFELTEMIAEYTDDDC